MSRFDRLPVELQIEIFTHCLPSFSRFDACEAPLLISRVSQAWRALALSVPKLWSSFEVEVWGSGSSTLGYDSHVERSMKLWLARSKNNPLTVSIIHVPVGRIPDGRSARLLALLIPEAHRWRSVQFIVPTSTMISLPTSHFPSLQSFGLQLKGLWRTEPSLNISTCNIPWRQLSRLDLQLEPNNLPTLGDMSSILSQTSRLQMCKFSVDCVRDSGVAFVDLHLPVLEELHLILQGGNGFSSAPASSLTQKFLHHLSMPTLRALNITWLVQGNTLLPGCPLFLSFLRRISSTLKTLSLAYLPVSEIDLIEILTPFSKLTHCHLRFSLSDHEYDPVSDNILSLLTICSPFSEDSKGSQPLLPSLLSLDLQCNGSDFSNSALLAMVKSRWKKDADPVDRFSHFGLLSMKPKLREFEKQVGFMRREGLDISVETLFLS